MQLLQIRRCARRVLHALSPQLGATSEELAHEGTVEHLFEDVRERLLGAPRVADFLGQSLEGVERERVDVGDEGDAEQHERLVQVLEIMVREQRRAPQERAARAAAVTRSLTALLERVR